MSDSLWPHGHQVLCPWDFLGKSTGVGCHFLLQGIFLTQGSNPGLPHCRRRFTIWATGKSKVKEEREESWPKTQHSKSKDHSIWSHHFMANRWGNNANSDRLFSWALNTGDGDCSHEVKRHLLLGRKVMTNLDSILTSRDITLPTKFHLVKAMVFPVVIYGCELDHKESWVLKNDAFELWCWRRLLRVPWIARRSNQPILKEISLEYSLEGLKLKLKLQ